MARIKWSLKLSVGIESIDVQHQKLLNMINYLDSAINDGKDDATLLILLKGLEEYAIIHFKYKESLLDKYGYSELSLHQVDHREFEYKVREFIDQYNINSLTIYEDILEYLVSWLYVHISVSDRKYSLLLIENGAR